MANVWRSREALWYGTKVQILRRVDRFWVVVKFLEACPHHARGREVCMSHVNLVIRDPTTGRRQPLRMTDKVPCTEHVYNYASHDIIRGKIRFEWLLHPIKNLYVVFDDHHLEVCFVNERGEFMRGIGYYRDDDPRFEAAIEDAVRSSKKLPPGSILDGFVYPTQGQLHQLASYVV